MVDFFTVPPVFVSVYLNRSWLGKSLLIPLSHPLPPVSSSLLLNIKGKQSVLIQSDRASAKRERPDWKKSSWSDDGDEAKAKVRVAYLIKMTPDTWFPELLSYSVS